MPWYVKTAPHWRTLFDCGHVYSECACVPRISDAVSKSRRQQRLLKPAGKNAKKTHVLEDKCPACRLK